MNLSSQKSAIALSASAAALLMPVSAFAEDGAAGADILIPKMAEFIPALIAFLIIWIVLAKVALPGIMKTMEERGKKIYTVVSGDDPLKIAAKNGITLDELKAMNPGVDGNLFPGDELLIANSVPYLGVKVTETIRYEEELEYEITQRTDPDHDIGYYQIVQQGEKGVQRGYYVLPKLLDFRYETRAYVFDNAALDRRIDLKVCESLYKDRKAET